MTEAFECSDGHSHWRAPYDQVGRGASLLCFPAPSTICMRDEMRELAERFAPFRRAVRLDWPGLGVRGLA